MDFGVQILPGQFVTDFSQSVHMCSAHYVDIQVIFCQFLYHPAAQNPFQHIMYMSHQVDEMIRT